MKTYVYVKTKETSNGNVTLKIYRMKMNIPHYVTECKFNNSSTCGKDNEAFRALIDCGELPKKYLYLSECKYKGKGLYCKEVEDKGIKIYGMN